MNVEARIIAARGGEVIVGIHSIQNSSVEDAARQFGLFPEPENYLEISSREAEAVLVAVLAEDMAYHCELMARDEAVQLAAEFIGQFANESAQYYTNGDYGKPKSAPGVGWGWVPVTNSTFDTGVLVVSPSRIACAWFMDED